MTRVVLIEKDKCFPIVWKKGGGYIMSSTLRFKCLWCYTFTTNHIPIIEKINNNSHYGICKECAEDLRSY